MLGSNEFLQDLPIFLFALQIIRWINVELLLLFLVILLVFNLELLEFTLEVSKNS